MDNIEMCGVLVHARPDRIEDARAVLEAMHGVEVHAATEDGRMIVTVEEFGGDKTSVKTLNSFNDVDGVLSTSVVYQHSESNEEPAQ